MKKVLVATDFSERSDRAIRRAILLAKRFKASLFLVHVIDDDQPPRLIKAEQEVASDLLSEQVHSIREEDGLICDYSVALGKPFKKITETGKELDADLLVIGSHRRQILRDVFIGTTAERTIRESNLPVLMANGVPSGQYRNVLVAVDLSQSSPEVVRTAYSLGLLTKVSVSVVHVFDVFGLGLMRRGASTEDEIKNHIAEEEERVSGELRDFLRATQLRPDKRVVIQAEDSVADTLHRVANDLSTQLLILGTQDRKGIDKFLLGSVAEQVLGVTDRDVLVVPTRSSK